MIVRGNVNGNAKKNKKHPGKEQRKIRRALSACKDFHVDVTTSEIAVRGMCQNWMKDPVDIAVLSGGDGIIQVFMTTWFREQYRRFGRGMTPQDFANRMNAMALDPSCGVQIPAIYQRPQGTVCFYSDMLGMSGDLQTLAEKIRYAEIRGQGIQGLKRVYIPVFMVYSTDHPNDLEEIFLGTTYADGFLFNVFHAYYEPKRKGKDSSMASALNVIGRTASSVLLDRMLPRESIAGKLYRSRYSDKILKKVRGKVTLDQKWEVIGEGQERNALAFSTMGINLYGIKPFYAVPANPEKFVMYEEGAVETPEQLSIDDHRFQVFCGDIDPVKIVGQLPNLYLGKETRIEGMTDKTAKRVDTENDEHSKFIIDGEDRSNGRNTTGVLAYLQPFLVPDIQYTGDSNNRFRNRMFNRAMEEAQDQLDEIVKRLSP